MRSKIMAMLTRHLLILAAHVGAAVLFSAPWAAGGYLVTDGSRIVEVDTGEPAQLNGINWFGFETANFAPHGLWQRSMDSFLDQMGDLGYNFLRVPYCNEMFNPGVMPNGINFWQNPDLEGLTPIQILDTLIEKAGARGMRIMLDRHRPTSSGQSTLWYTAQVTEQRWIDDWTMLAARYADSSVVVAADLHNEPHGAATWGTGDLATDWRLAAERCGNAILEVNPDWLIVVGGIENHQNDFYWWGGNLMGARNHPVRLAVANRLVYSPHDYGPGVYSQPWFSDPAFPANMPGIWNKYWAYLHLENIAPILVGEFGGRKTDNVSSEGIWQNTLVDYLAEHGMYWTYWCWNPNSGDTGGVLLDDWQTIDESKQAMLNRLIDVSPPAPNDDIIIDNTDPLRVTLAGSWFSSTSITGFYGSDYLHDDNAGKGTKTVRFTPDLMQAGAYEVFLMWAAFNRATAVPVDIVSATGTISQAVNQRENGGQWVSLGVHSFDAGSSGSLFIRTGGTSDYVVVDAVRFSLVRALPHPMAVALESVPGGIRLTWPTVPGSRYRVQMKSQLSGPLWLNRTEVTATGPSASWDDAAVAGTASRFYRIIFIE